MVTEAVDAEGMVAGMAEGAAVAVRAVARVAAAAAVAMALVVEAHTVGTETMKAVSAVVETSVGCQSAKRWSRRSGQKRARYQ